MKKTWTLICCAIAVFSIIAGLVFGNNAFRASLPQLPGLESPPLTGMAGRRTAVLKVTSLSIYPEYRSRLPHNADLDEKVFTQGKVALGTFMMNNKSNSASGSIQPLFIQPPIVTIPLDDAQRQSVEPRFAKNSLFLETGNSLAESAQAAFPGRSGVASRSQVLKNETVQISPSKVKQDLVTQSGYYNEKNELVPFVAQFEITFVSGNNSRVFVSVVENQFGSDKKLWKRLQLDGEFAVTK